MQNPQYHKSRGNGGETTSEQASARSAAVSATIYGTVSALSTAYGATRQAEWPRLP